MKRAAKRWPTRVARAFIGMRGRALCATAIVLAPGMTLLLLSDRRAHEHARYDAEGTTLGIARDAADLHSDLVSETRVLLETLAADPAVAQMGPDCDRRMRRLLDLRPAYANLGVVDADGILRCAAIPAPAGQEDLSDRPWVHASIEAKGFAVGGYELGTITGRPLFGVGLAVLDGRGEVAYVIGAGIDTAWPSELLESKDLPPGAVLTLVDSDATVLARSEDPDRYVGMRGPEVPVIAEILLRRGEGIVEAAELDGVERLYSYTELSDSGGYVYAGIPTDTVFAQADADYRRDIFFAVAIAAVALVFGFVLTHLTVWLPVRRVTAAVDRIRAGDLGARSGIRASDEFGGLASAFDEMADSLQGREEALGEANRGLEKTVAELSRSQDALRRMLAALVTAQEDERKRIAGEVHDDSVQTVTALALQLQLLRRQLAAAGQTEFAERIVELEEVAGATVDRLRTLLFALHSPVLERQGLATAVDTLLTRTFDPASTRWEVQDLLDNEPPAPTGSVAYRVVQEAVLNVARHAAATRVDVVLERRGNGLALTVTDDGAGFDEARPEPGHLGLEGMRQRARLAGGYLSVSSAAGKGTTISGWIPWDDAAPDSRDLGESLD